MDNAELIQILRSTRGDYDDEHAWHRFLLDAYAGTGGFAGKVKPTAISHFGWAAEAYSSSGFTSTMQQSSAGKAISYLDQFPREDEEKYKQRVGIAHYTNYVATIADLLCSYVSKEHNAREGIDNTAVAEWMTDVNNGGTSWDAMMRDTIVLRCALLGWMPVLTDAPPVGAGVTNAAQAVAVQAASGGNVKPRAIPLFPVNMLDWQCDESGNFMWVKLFTPHVDQPDPMLPAVEYDRVAYWYPDRAEVYKIIRKDDGEVAEGPEVFPHSFGRVPIEVFRHKATPDDPVRGIPMLHDVAVAARRLFNLESELDDHIRSCVFAILGLPVEDTSADIQGIAAGNGSVIKVPMTANMPLHFVAPPETVAATLETRIANTVREIYRMARIEYARSTGGAQSGESKAYDFEQTNRRLGDFSAQLARSEQRLLKMVAPALSMSEAARDKIAITSPTSFRVEDLATDLENALNAIKVKLGPTAIEQMRARLIDKLLPNLPRELRDKAMKELASINDAPEPPPALPAAPTNTPGGPVPPPVDKNKQQDNAAA